MHDSPPITILPYTHVVGQEQLKLALELSYIAPRVGGVLISGQRGTGKSTAVRAFSQMMYGRLPVTLPINATEDRVVGGWKIDELMGGRAEPQEGLLEEADQSLLYVDEINLLDDHIVNIILDVTSTGILVVQREGRREQKPTSFTLVGTMNPEEGGLRPQLLDRFGLMVNVTAETDGDLRGEVLRKVLALDEGLFQMSRGLSSQFIESGAENDRRLREEMELARERFYEVDLPPEIARKCVALAESTQAEGHRGDYVLALAARACAARGGVYRVGVGHLEQVAQLALQHRRPGSLHGERVLWTSEDEERTREVLASA
jgi:magnesium chelatase subunit I